MTTDSDHPERFKTSIENLCPKCRTAMSIKETGDFDVWVCPQIHGVGITISEAYGHLQEDEIKAIWEAAKKGTTAIGLLCFESDKPMKEFTVTVDDDEIEGNSGPNARQMTLHMAIDEQMIWFDGETLGGMPEDMPNAQPTAEQQGQLDQITKSFGDDLTAAWGDRENHTLGGRLHNFLSSYGAYQKVSTGATKVAEPLSKVVMPGYSVDEIIANIDKQIDSSQKPQ